MVKVPGIDGRETDVMLPPDGWRYMAIMCCGSCFPCFIPPLWSAEKKEQYLNLIKSFSFIVSFIQVGLLSRSCPSSPLILTALQVIVFIVELSMGGVVSWDDNPSLGPGGGTIDQEELLPYLSSVMAW